MKKSNVGLLNQFQKIENGKVSIALPLRTVSEANSSEHWTEKSKRHRLQRRTVAFLLNPIKKNICLPCVIKVTRYAPRSLDKHDNLPMSVKYIVDACCAIITGDFRHGQADNDERISITYDQVISQKYGVVLEFTFAHLCSSHCN